MKKHTRSSDLLSLADEGIRYSREERAMQFAAFDALEFCRMERPVPEPERETDEFPEMYRGPEFDIEIC